jgi:divalent metal cation (Fe/Co/Zn/Cd) transporter
MSATDTSTEAHDDVTGAAARRARWLAYVTVGWMVAEATVALWAAARANSVALLGFGGDSVIEVASGAVVLWRFSSGASGGRERRAAQLVGWGLIALAVFVALDSTAALVQGRAPAVSVPGILLTASSVVIMPLLAAAKRRVAAQAGSRALAGDARQSDICAWLSAVTLVGLGLRATSGWRWADAAAALALVPLIASEGIAALRAKPLADSCRNQMR